MINSKLIESRLHADYSNDEALEENAYNDYYIKEIDRLSSLDTTTPKDYLNLYAKSDVLANRYFREAVSILQENKYEPELVHIFETNILNRVSNDTFRKTFFTPDYRVLNTIKEECEDLYNTIQSVNQAICIATNHKIFKPDISRVTNDKALMWNICKEACNNESIDANTKAIMAIGEAYFLSADNIDKNSKSIIEYFRYIGEDIDIENINEFFSKPYTLDIKVKDVRVTPITDPVAELVDGIFATGNIVENLSIYVFGIIAKLTRNSINLASLGKANTLLKDKMYNILNTANSSGTIDGISSILLKGIDMCDNSIAMNQNMDPDFIHNFIQFKEFLQDLLGFVNDFYNIKYDYPNEMAVAIMDESFKDIIDNITSTVSNAFIGANGIFTKFKEIKDKLPLRKFKTYKAKNLITIALGIDKQIRDRMSCYRKNGLKGVFGALKKKFTLKEDMDITNEVLSEMVTSEGNIIISVGRYLLNSNIDYSDISYFKELCSTINNNLNEGLVYYICTENEVEFFYRDMTTEVELTTEETNMLESYLSEYDKEDIAFIESYASLNEINMDTLTEALYEADSKEFNGLLELFSAMHIDRDYIDEMYTNIVNHKIEEDPVTGRDFKLETFSNIVTYEENYDITLDDGEMLEACEILSSILEKNSEWDDIDLDDDEDNEKKSVKHNKKPVDKHPAHHEEEKKDIHKKEETPDEKKKKFKGINLNDIKLFLAGIKDKAKNLSAKEKALSRNVDTTFNMFMNSLEKAMVSDRREAIIKGSVIPSFSKSIKIALGLAGLGILTGGPAVPVIAALGAFACSKSLTKKERALLLDDIVIEMEVLDKEIQVAENNNNYKKMRELMKTKRELERQYARIQYNARVGKDMIPSRNADRG